MLHSNARSVNEGEINQCAVLPAEHGLALRITIVANQISCRQHSCETLQAEELLYTDSGTNKNQQEGDELTDWLGG
jgi:hypothetical protein